MFNKQDGFAIIPVLIILGLSTLGGAFGTYLVLQNQQKISQEELQLGTSANIFYVTSLLPNATSTDTGSIGTTSSSGDRRFRYGFIDYSTSTAIDIYDSLRVGRSASTTIDELGNVTVQDLTVSGTCTGCGAAAVVDLQDAYNNSAADAQITSADAKEFIYFISDTTDPAEFIISAADQGSLQINVGSTTNQILFAYGAHGIGTSTPGTGLSIAATSTNLSSLTVEGFAKAGVLIATNTIENRGTATSSWANAGLSVAGGGLASSQGITLTGGDLLLTAGKLTVAGAATSTAPALNVSTLLQSAYIDLSGRLDSSFTGTSTFAGDATIADLLAPSGLYVSGSGTSTFEGGGLLRTGGLRILTGGLDIAGGDLLSAGTLKVSSTATSTIAGTLSIDSTTGTSTIAGSLDIAKSLLVGGAVHLQMASTTNVGTTTVFFDCSLAPRATAIFDKDGSGVVYKNCFGGDVHTAIIDIPKTDLINGIRVNWLGIMDANGEYGTTSRANASLYWPVATSTVGYMSQGAYNVCVAMFATTSDNLSTIGIADCGDKGYRAPY